MAPALALVLLAAGLRAADTVVVLGGETAAYRQALDGFRESFDLPFEVRSASERRALPPEARVVVALGGRAAMARYPADVVLIYAMAPKVIRGSIHHPGRVAAVSMHPPASWVVSKFKGKRLGVLWWSSGLAGFISDLEKAGGVAVLARRVGQGDTVADALRSLHGKVDALWLPADPALVAQGTCETIVASATAWSVPIYVALPGILPREATGVVGASFRDIGRAAAAAARDGLDGRLQPRYRPEVP